MDRQGIQSMVLTLGSGQIWLGNPPVVLQFIVVNNCLFRKNIRSQEPNLRFRFTVVVVKSRRRPGDQCFF